MSVLSLFTDDENSTHEEAEEGEGQPLFMNESLQLLLDRENEILALQQAFSNARHGQDMQVVRLVGDIGTGKTHLITTFVKQQQQQQHQQQPPQQDPSSSAVTTDNITGPTFFARAKFEPFRSNPQQFSSVLLDALSCLALQIAKYADASSTTAANNNNGNSNNDININNNKSDFPTKQQQQQNSNSTRGTTVLVDESNDRSNRSSEHLNSIAKYIKRTLFRALPPEELDLLLRAVPGLEDILQREPTPTTMTSTTTFMPTIPTTTPKRLLNFLLETMCQSLRGTDDAETTGTNGLICLLLDDLHWADTQSLEWIDHFIHTTTTTNCPSLVLVCAHRPKGRRSSFQNFLRMDRRSHPCHDLVLYNWAIHAVMEFLQQTLALVVVIKKTTNTTTKTTTTTNDPHNMNTNTLEPLAEWIMEVTHGNPLHVVQYLKLLYEQGHLKYIGRHWHWDMDQLRANRIDTTTRTTTLTTIGTLEGVCRERLLLLPEFSRLAVILGAYLGFQFDATVVNHTLDVLLEDYEPNLDVLKELGTAVDHGLLEQKGENQLYCFAHDTVRHAAYMLLDDTPPHNERRTSVHLGVARMLHREMENQLKEGEPDRFVMFADIEHWYIYLTANQWNHATKLITEFSERADLAEVNQRAAECAMEETAYSAALKYTKVGLKLLDYGWEEENHYSLQLKLSTTLAQAEYCLGNYSNCMAVIDQLFSHVQEESHEFPLYPLRLEILTTQYKLNQCIESGLFYLQRLDVKMPRVMVPKQRKLKKLVIREDTFRKLGRMRDSKMLIVMQVLNVINKACWLLQRKEFEWVVLQQIHLTKEYGFAEGSNYALLCYGFLCAQRGYFDEGLRVAEVALNLAKFRAKSKNNLARNTVLFRSGLYHLKNPLHDNLSPLLKGYQTGIAVGDRLHAAQCYCVYLSTYIFCGLPLDALLHDMSRFCNNLSSFGNEIPTVKVLLIYREFVLGLTDPSKSVERESRVDVAIRHDDGWKNEIVQQTYLFVKLLSSVYFGDTALAKEIFEKLQQHHETITGGSLHHVPVLLQAKAMVALSLWSNTKDRRNLRLSRKLIRKLDSWHKVNCEHRVLFLYAETMLVTNATKGKTVKAYETAIESARKHGFISDAAFATERLACFHLKSKRTTASTTSQLFQNAYDLYCTWGAYNKCTQLRNNHSFSNGRQQQPPTPPPQPSPHLALLKESAVANTTATTTTTTALTSAPTSPKVMRRRTKTPPRSSPSPASVSPTCQLQVSEDISNSQDGLSGDSDYESHNEDFSNDLDDDEGDDVDDDLELEGDDGESIISAFRSVHTVS